MAAPKDLGERLRQRDVDTPRSLRPFRLDTLPTHLDYHRALELTELAPGRLVALVGVGGDDLVGLGPDLLAGAATAIVAGPARSGRSTVLLTMARSDLAGRPGVRAVFTGEDLTVDELEPVLGEAAGPAVLLVDDAELLKNCAADSWLAELVSRAGRDGRGVIVAGETADVGAGFSNWQVPLRRNRCGVLIAPNDIMAGDVVGCGCRGARSGHRPSPDGSCCTPATASFAPSPSRSR